MTNPHVTIIFHYETLKMEWIKTGENIDNIRNKLEINSFLTYRNLMHEWERKNAEKCV